jgi:hypothetical protein
LSSYLWFLSEGTIAELLKQRLGKTESYQENKWCPGAIFTTVYFLRNLQIGPISQSVTLQ